MSVSLRPVLMYLSLALRFALVLGTLFTVPLSIWNYLFVGADDSGKWKPLLILRKLALHKVLNIVLKTGKKHT